MELNWFIASLLGATIFGTNGFLIRLGSTRHRDSGLLTLLGVFTSGAIAFTIFAIAEGIFSFAPDVILIGVLIGVGAVFGNMAWIRAFNHGPASLTGPIVNSYNVLIILMSLIFFDEVLTLKEIIAIAIILASVSLLSYDPNEQLRIKDRRWVLYVVLAILLFFMRNGGLKITEESGYNNTTLLAYGYMLGIVWFGYTLIGRHDLLDLKTVRFSLGLGLIAGIGSFGGLYLYSYALESGPASIVAPVFSLNGLVFATLTIILLRERLSRYQVVALIGTVAGLVLLRI